MNKDIGPSWQEHFRTADGDVVRVTTDAETRATPGPRRILAIVPATESCVALRVEVRIDDSVQTTTIDACCPRQDTDGGT